MTVKTYTAAEQEELLRRYMRQGSFRAMALLGRKQHEIEQLMLERAAGVGITEYGDETWHKPLEVIDRESMEEAADLVFYETVYNLKERRVIP